MKPKTVFTVENIVNVWETHPDASSPIAVFEKNGTTESSAPAKRTSSLPHLVITDEIKLLCWLIANGFYQCIGFRKPFVKTSELRKLLLAGLDAPGCSLDGDKPEDDGSDRK